MQSDGENELPAETVAFEATNIRPEEEPTEVSSLYDTIKQAFKDALFESRELLIGIAVEAMQAVHQSEYVEPEPDIPYDKRRHGLLLIFGVSAPAFLLLVLSGAFIGISGHWLRSLVALVVYWGIIVLLGILITRRVRRMDGRNKKRTSRMMYIGWVVALLVLGIIVTVILSVSGVAVYFTIGYFIVSVVLVYAAARELFKWARFHIYRNEGTLKAERPASVFFLLNRVDETLVLATVTTCDVDPTWLQERFGAYKLVIDTAGDKDEYWNKLTFIVNGPMLQETVLQGIEQGRR